MPGRMIPGEKHKQGVIDVTPNSFENAAGVTPPGYEGTRDPITGELLDQYKLDPYSGEALQALKGQAFSQGPSPWADLQTQQQQMEQNKAYGAAQRQQMQGQSQAESQLARTGGLTGGASALLARQGARDLLSADQNVSQQGMAQRLGIQQQDLERKQGLLGQFAQSESQANQANITEAENDINRKASFDSNRYNQQMQAWGAKQSADAQRAASQGGGKK